MPRLPNAATTPAASSGRVKQAGQKQKVSRVAAPAPGAKGAKGTAAAKQPAAPVCKPSGAGRRPSKAQPRALKPSSGLNFHVETYMEVTRWTAETTIEFIANPKQKGSKSYDRYNAYMKCRTIGDVLHICKAQDLLWDYERGFYRVTGGPVRDEPVDLRRAEVNGTVLTETDRLLGRWVTKELARRVGMTVKQASSEAGMHNESAISHMLKTIAEREALQVLARCVKECRRITDEEITGVLSSWVFKRNTSRQNVMPDGSDFVFSDTAGINVARDGSVHATRHSGGYPGCLALMCQWMRERLPEGEANFPFSSINMNFGYGAKLHRDNNNEGYSVISGFGGFAGGDIRYWGEDDQSVATSNIEEIRQWPSTRVNPGDGLLLFDAHRAHEVLPFEGQRYTLVWFNCKRFHKAPKEELAALRDVGFNIPTKAGLAAMVRKLSKPRGNGSGVSSPNRDTAVLWPRAAGPRTKAENSHAEKVLKNVRGGKLKKLVAKTSRAPTGKRSCAGDSD